MFYKSFILLFLMMATSAFADSRVLAFGDSLTQGYGLPENEGLVPQLERWLREHGHEDVVIVNGGVSGDTTAGGAARIEWSLADEFNAVIVTLGGNDLLRGLSPEETKKNLSLIIEAIQKRDIPVLLIGMKAPQNMGQNYKRAFDGVYEALSQETGAGFIPFFFEALGQTPEELRPFMQDDGIHPNAEGVAKIVEKIGPEISSFLKEMQK